MAFRALSVHSLKEQFKTLCHLTVFCRDELILLKSSISSYISLLYGYSMILLYNHSLILLYKIEQTKLSLLY